MEWNDLVVGQVLHLAHFPERKSTKGVPNRWKINLHQICFSKPRMIWYHKGSVAILFWDEKRLWLGSGGLKQEYSVPNFERKSHPPRPLGWSDWPKTLGAYSYVNQTWFATKKPQFRTIAQLTPSAIIPEGGNWGNVQICAFFALRSRPFTAPLFDWDHFCSKLKLELWVTRWCA